MKTIFGLFLALFLTACATPYQKIGTDISGGHAFIQLAPDVFKVSFNGNGFTESKRASDFALLRAAEITLEHNYSSFVILGEGDRSSVQNVHTEMPTYTNGTVTNYGNGTAYYTATTTPSGFDMPVVKPGHEITIRCFSGRPPAHSGEVYDAARVAADLRAKYRLTR